MCQHDALDERLYQSKPLLSERQVICSWHMNLSLYNRVGHHDPQLMRALGVPSHQFFLSPVSQGCPFWEVHTVEKEW